ncbi:HEAT repeat domain-containing protein [Candidatus Sumerlaeota bacterium]|nr:HEAT repeat domain-containing protein [Candidatus Sumerlaeota bacterium]
MRHLVVPASILFLGCSGLHAMAGESDYQCAHAGFHAPAAFNEVTGENPDHFPEEQEIDIEHIRLEMNFPGLETKSATVVETIVFNAAWEMRSDITLDARDLDIQGIERLDDSALSITQSSEVKEFGTREGLDYFVDGDRLHIHFPTAIGKGERAAIRLRYSLHDPKDGMFWIEPLPNDPDQRWEVWTQGEASSNRYWFAGHDYPNDRMTSEIVARVPLPNVVSAAGTLVSRNENGDGTVTYHWRIDQTHVNYLTSLVIGLFDVQRGEVDGVQLEYYVPPQRAGDSQRSFAKTAEMIRTFGKLFDEPFPYPRYAQIVVRDFTSGGMENVTATTLAARMLVGESMARHSPACVSRSESVIAHEIAHSWFGDLITCRNWAHLWLNEGWASYAQALWAEASCGKDEYAYGIWNRRREVAANDPLDSQQPLVFHRHGDPEVMFRFNDSAVYDKGGFILHMLRRKLGDEAFWKGTREYIDKYRNQVVETAQFRGAMEAASGQDLEAFFRQWCETPGTPPVQVALTYDSRERAAIITVEQTAKLTGESPAFRGEMKFFLQSRGGEVVERTFDVTLRKHTFSIPLEKAPAAFAVDPDAAFLMDLTLKAPVNVLRDSMRQAPTVIGRCDAVHAYAREAGSNATGSLRDLVRDADMFYGVRVEAALALGEVSGDGAANALATLAQEMSARAPEETDWRVREAIAKALGQHRGDAAKNALKKLVDDPSDPVVAAAATSLVTFFGSDIDEMLMRAFERRGENERIATAALGAMTKRASAQAMDAAIRLSDATASHFSTRVRAIQSMGELLEGRESSGDDDKASGRLLELVNDPRRQVGSAAIAAIGRGKLKPAIPTLQQLAGKTDDADVATAARNAMTAINDKKGTRSDVMALEEKVNALETRLDALEKTPGDSSQQKKRRRFLGIF